MRAMPISLLLLSACSGGGGEDPEPTPIDPTVYGTFSVSYTDVQLDLGERGGGFPSRVDARVHWPETDREVPVVVFHHGFQVRTDQYFDLLAQLASWGVAVVAPQYDSGLSSFRTHAQLRDDAVAVLDALDTIALEDGPTLDVGRVGFAGHSRGGKQAIQGAAADDRVDAVVTLDPVDVPPPFGDADPADYPPSFDDLAGLTIPYAQLGMAYGPDAAAPGLQACAPAEGGYARLYDAAPDGAVQHVVQTGGHNDLVDDCAAGEGGLVCNLCPAGDDPAANNAYSRAFLVAAFGRDLLDEAGFEGWLRGAVGVEGGPEVAVWVNGELGPEDTGAPVETGDTDPGETAETGDTDDTDPDETGG